MRALPLTLALNLVSCVALGLAGCAAPSGGESHLEPSFVSVSIEGDLGSADAPLPFSTEDVTWTVSAVTLDRHGDPYDFDGDLKVRVRPGTIQMDPWVTLTDGEWTGEVTFRGAFGPSRVWLGDEGDKSSDSTRAPSWATGVSDTIWYEQPTVAEMQTTDDHEVNQLNNEFVEFRMDDRQVVVTTLSTAGFWATDLSDPVGSFNNLFVYTFNEPRDVVVGDRLEQLSGVNQEYLATTQISFPVYSRAEGETLTPPDAVVLDAVTACDDLEMEALESALVQADRPTVSDTLGDTSSEDYLDWVEYGQWPIEIDGDEPCTIYVSNTTSVPDFDPSQYVGQELPLVAGMLSEVWGRWIVTVRTPADLGLEDEEAAALPAPPKARPNPSLHPIERSL